MPKSRTDKEKIVASLLEELKKAKSVVFVDYKGLRVKDTEELRAKLRESGVSYKVAKNTLLSIAFSESKIKVSDEVLSRPLALAIGFEDQVSAAKGIADFAKNHESLEILGGILDEEFISGEKVNQLAALPGRDELRAKLLSLFNAPALSMVRVVNAPASSFINLLNNKVNN